MKPDQLYQQLKDLAQKLDITVLEKSLKNVGLHVKSGYCKIKGKKHYIMDKNLPIRRKTRLLGNCLKKMPCDDLYVLPAVRKFLEK